MHRSVRHLKAGQDTAEIHFPFCEFLLSRNEKPLKNASTPQCSSEVKSELQVFTYFLRDLQNHLLCTMKTKPDGGGVGHTARQKTRGLDSACRVNFNSCITLVNLFDFFFLFLLNEIDKIRIPFSKRIITTDLLHGALLKFLSLC